MQQNGHGGANSTHTNQDVTTEALHLHPFGRGVPPHALCEVQPTVASGNLLFTKRRKTQTAGLIEFRQPRQDFCL